MRHIQFLSSWIGTGASEQDPQRPSAEDLWHANGVQWSNLRDMGQPHVLPDPNLCVWEAWVEDAGVALLEADPSNYSILLDEDAGGTLALAKEDAKESKPKDEKPDATTKTTLESFLKTKGVKDADAATLCKKSDANATRKTIADGLVAWCNGLPKAKKK